MRERRGFTLIELMLVIAILALVGVLVVIGRRSAQRASNERNAAATLKTLASAEADFRSNDRDGNRIQDFWTRDVAGLYGVVPVGDQAMIRLIDVSTAGADFAAAGSAAPGVTGLEEVDRDLYTRPAPKAGYWYQRMLSDGSSGQDLPYQTNTEGVVRPDGTPSRSLWWNHSRFGFYAFPDDWGAGRHVFILNEGNTIFRRAMTGPVKPPSALPNPSGTRLLYGNEGLVGPNAPEIWPNASLLKAQFSGCSDH